MLPEFDVGDLVTVTAGKHAGVTPWRIFGLRRDGYIFAGRYEPKAVVVTLEIFHPSALAEFTSPPSGQLPAAETPQTQPLRVS